MPEITLYSGVYEITFYGKISYNTPPGIKTVVLADGTLVTNKTHKKNEFTVQIETIDDANLAGLLARSDEPFYYDDGGLNHIYFYIISSIGHVPYTRFPGYHSVSFQARQV